MVSALGNRLRNALAGLGALVVLVHVTPLNYWWASWLNGPSVTLSAGDVLLIPTGSVEPDGVIGLGSYWRAVYALQAWRAVPSARMLLSGGGTYAPQAAEAIVVRDFLLASGAPNTAITIETASMSTRENALYSAPLAAQLPGRKVLLTSDYHMFRALRAYRKAGIDCEPYPIPDIKKRHLGSWRGRWTIFCDLVVETVKIAYYAARGWL